MIQKKMEHPGVDWQFLLFCLCGSMTGYLLFLDRLVPLNAIWNNHLWFLAGIFIFGVIYELEYFSIAFWLLVALGVADLVGGLNADSPEPSCWGGFIVWFLAVAAGFAGCIVSVFVPRNHWGEKFKTSN